VHIIWDNSNIFLSGRNMCNQKEYNKGAYFRIHFESLIDLAADNRPVEQVFCVGSVPPPTDSVWGHIKHKTGKQPELYERGAQSGKEQAVDQALQTRMLRLGYDYTPPETLILLSGDGKGFEEGVGFYSDIKRLHKIGWNIEVMSWNNSCKKEMKKWAKSEALFVSLDDFYAYITFLEGLRPVRALNLSGRPRKIY
jgi:hypothetical protein